MEPELDIQFYNEVIDENNNVKYFKSGSRYLYWHRIYAQGRDLDKVKEITYILHSSFANPIRKISTRSNGFELITWAWGEFTIKTIITTIDGEEHYKDFPFRFGDKLRDAKRNNIEFKEMQY